jgi:predicted permease
MDFTFPIAFLEGAVASFVAALVAALIMRRIPKYPARIFVVVVAGAIVATSVNWGQIGMVPPHVAAIDLCAIAVAAMLGCALGAAPVRLGLRLKRYPNSN